MATKNHQFELEITAEQAEKRRSVDYQWVWRDGNIKGFHEGHQEGYREGIIEVIFVLLEDRHIRLSDEGRKRILVCTDLDQLTKWAIRASQAAGEEELFA